MRKRLTIACVLPVLQLYERPSLAKKEAVSNIPYRLYISRNLNFVNFANATTIRKN